MPRVTVQVKEVTRLRTSTGIEEQAFLVIDLDPWSSNTPVVQNPDADFAYPNISDAGVARGWFRTATSPLTFAPDADLVDPSTVAPPVDIEEAKTVTAAALETVKGVAADLERLLAGLGAIQG